VPWWVVAESRSANPLIDMTMMRQRAVWTTNLSALLFGAGLYSVLAFVPSFVQAPSSAGYGFGASITEAGIMVLPLTAMMFVFGMFTGKLAERFGSKNLAVLGTTISAFAFLMLAYVHDQKFDIYLAMAIMGIGFGMATSALANLIVAAVPPEQTGVASGMNANIRTIGGAIGSAIASSIVVSGSVGEIPKESGYTNGFVMLTGATLLSLLAAVLVPRVRRNPVTHREPPVELRHPELAIVAGGTLVGDDPE
jgi:MFS family permease